ncbi:phage head closure protein [Pseudoroseicyclus sp. H15]
MPAGRLRDRVQFQRQAAGEDEYGNVQTGPWEDLGGKIWADMLERLGGEKLAAGAIHAPRTATIRVRKSSFTSGITEGDAIAARGETWNIRSIAEVGRKGELLEMTCEAEVAQ